MNVRFVDDNLALNKPVSQISTYANAVAGLAVDGVPNTVSCTVAHVHPWWSVDLGAAFSIGHVIVTNDANEPAGNYF